VQAPPYATGFTDRHIPAQVEALIGMRVLKAHAGDAFSAVLARTDERTYVVTWGCGLHGQLGHSGGPIHLGVPRVVEELKGLRAFDEQSNTVVPLNVVDLAVGSNHSLALLSDGSVLTWGQNQHGQVCVCVCM
jgi:alpha-tubulin suppressor-like RCC1 family protein